MVKYLNFVDVPVLSINLTTAQPLHEGTTLSLVCNDIKNDDTNTSYSWLYKGQNLNKTTNVLQIQNITRQERGIFTCRGQNIAGEGMENITLDVLCK